MKTRASQTARISRRSAIALLSVAPAGLAQVARPGAGTGAAAQARQTVLEPLMPFRQFNRFGYKDRIGKLVIKPVFEGAGSFYDALGRQRQVAWVRMGGKFGYLDRQGEFIIRPAFETIREFSEGFAAVQLNGKFGFINENARMAIEPKFDEVDPFSNGLAVVRLDGRTGWVDRKGDFHTRRPGSGPAQ